MKRDFRVDVLRTIGIFSIMLAHSEPPNILFQVRMFDVPLMSMLLGMSFVLSMRGREFQGKYGIYLLKRFKRLIVPTWIFLTLIFVSAFLLTMIIGISYPFSLKQIITSYGLISGIGYVWIIRVFFIIALVSPILLVLSRKIKNLFTKIFIVYVLLFILQSLCKISELLSGKFSYLFDNLIIISFGYVVCALVGFWVVSLHIKELVIFTSSLIIPFLFLNIFIPFLSISDQKYPPTSFFILYGLSVSLILLTILSNSVLLAKINRISFLHWASKYSLELYFWHMIPILLFSHLMPNVSWILIFSVTVISSCVLTHIQTKFFPSLLTIK